MTEENWKNIIEFLASLQSEMFLGSMIVQQSLIWYSQIDKIAKSIKKSNLGMIEFSFSEGSRFRNTPFFLRSMIKKMWRGLLYSTASRMQLQKVQSQWTYVCMETRKNLGILKNKATRTKNLKMRFLLSKIWLLYVYGGNCFVITSIFMLLRTLVKWYWYSPLRCIMGSLVNVVGDVMQLNC